MVEIGEQVFDSPTRLGFLEESYFGGFAGDVQSPAWAVACGLALGSVRSQMREQNQGNRKPGWRM
ncbi:hypothetical protein WAJ43_22370, partial [Acinetobacter baumannii]